jgi:hypothetical protein
VCETFLIFFCKGFVRNYVCETFLTFFCKGFVPNLWYETIFLSHQVEVSYETSFLRNQKRIFPCDKGKILFWFRKIPFFFSVHKIKLHRKKSYTLKTFYVSDKIFNDAIMTASLNVAKHLHTVDLLEIGV